MSFWQPEHQALLDAVRADDTVPILVRRLTNGLLTPNPTDARRWRGWALALQATTPGRELVEMRHSTAAWPQVWEDCPPLSPLAEHHCALLFRELSSRLAQMGELKESCRHWGWSLRAWSRLEQSTYLADLGEKLTAGTPTDAAPIVSELMVPDIQRLGTELQRGLQLGADDFNDVDTALADWAWECLDTAAALIGDDGDAGVIARARQSAMEAKAYAVASATTRFRRGVDAIDWAGGDESSITAPFLWLKQVCDIVEFRENMATTGLKSMIDGAWKLRKIDRDEEPVFRALIDAGEPFAKAVIDQLEHGGAFGQGSRAADYLVFRGEQLKALDNERRAYFERALKFSPGHRNASLLYSYELLIDVENWLAQLAANPAFFARVPLVGGSVDLLLKQASERLDEVERIYPYNSRLDEYRTRVQEQADRLGIELEAKND